MDRALLSCPLCLQDLRRPVSTPCGHNFCEECLTTSLAESPGRCPLHDEPRLPASFSVSVNEQLASCVEFMRISLPPAYSEAQPHDAESHHPPTSTTTAPSPRETGQQAHHDGASHQSTRVPRPEQAAIRASEKDGSDQARLLAKLSTVAVGLTHSIKGELTRLRRTSSYIRPDGVSHSQAHAVREGRQFAEEAMETSLHSTLIHDYFEALHAALTSREADLVKARDAEQARRILLLQKQQNSAVELINKAAVLQERLVVGTESDKGKPKSSSSLARAEASREADTLLQTAELLSHPICSATVPVELPPSIFSTISQLGHVETTHPDPVYFSLINSRFIFDPDLDLPGHQHTEHFHVSRDRRTVKKVSDKGKVSTIFGRSLREQNMSTAEITVRFVIDANTFHDDKDKIGIQLPHEKASDCGVVVRLSDGSVFVAHKKKGRLGHGGVEASEAITFKVLPLEGRVVVSRSGKNDDDTVVLAWSPKGAPIHPIVRIKHIGWKITMH